MKSSKIAEAYNMDTQRHGTERFAHELYYSIIHLLNRQAAITERKCRKPNWDYCETCEALENLTAERDNLEADCKDWMKHAMAAENVCHETEQEREQYRKLFGMALDWAHEITMLETSIDEGMA